MNQQLIKKCLFMNKEQPIKRCLVHSGLLSRGREYIFFNSQPKNNCQWVFFGSSRQGREFINKRTTN